MAVTGTKVNGLAYERGSVTISWVGLDLSNTQEANYSDTLEPGKYRGMSGQITMVTRGEYDCDGDITLPKEDFQAVIDKLGDDYGKEERDITFKFKEDGAPLVVDILHYARVAGVEDAVSSNGEAAMVKLTLAPRWISRNGKRLSNKK